MLRILHHLKPHHLAAISAMLFVTILSLYVWQSIAGVERLGTPVHLQAQLKTQLSAITSKTPASEAQYSDKLKKLEELAADIDQYRISCSQAWAFQWLTVFPSVESKVRACQSSQSKITGLKEVTTDLSGFLKNEQALQALLTKLIPQKLTSPLDKTAQQSLRSATDAVLEELGELKTERSFLPVVADAEKRLTSVIGGWKALETADANQNQVAWNKAKGDLDQAYVDVFGIVDISDKQLSILLKNLEGTANTL